MKIKAICISIALTTAMLSGLTLGYPELVVAQAQTTINKNKKPRPRPKPKVPTPALLPGLVALGVGVLRKRKAEEAKVNK